MSAISEDSVRKTWNTLREFETRDLTSRNFAARHGGNLSASKAHEITSNFIQAREYFRNASAADITVRPLLQYYGVLALSRALVLFLVPGMRECSMKPSHGLKPEDWQQTLSSGLAGIADLRISMTEGTFHDLLVATDNNFYFRANSSAVNWQCGAGIPALESEFTFKDVASRIADISDQYAAWIGASNPFSEMQSFKIDANENQYEFTLPASVTDTSLNTIFPADKCPNRTINRDSTKVVVRYDQPFTPFFAQNSHGAFDIGDVVLYGPLNPDNYFTPLAACFMSSYILGMLARYFPSIWISLGRSVKGDAVYPLVTQMMDWIQETFPVMALDILRGPYDFEDGGKT